MAGIELKIATRVKASSIVEVIVAMVVIVIVFSIAMGIFANVQRLSLSSQKMQAQGILKGLVLTAEKLPIGTKQTLTIGSLRIEEEINQYEDNPRLQQVVLKAYDENNQQLAEVNQVLYDAQ